LDLGSGLTSRALALSTSCSSCRSSHSSLLIVCF
jgi:hypothetical protein